jgi:hypothetical protein
MRFAVLGLDAIKLHHFGLAGREPLLLMLAASLFTFAVTRLYTRIARVRSWRSGRVGEVHIHHMVAGSVLTLTCGMLEIAFQPRDFGVDLLAVGFGVGAAFVLDEFALSLHLRDVYWTPEGRHSIEASIIWTLLGLMLLAGIAPFGIHDQTETPRIVSFAVVIVAIVLSVVTCLKGKLTLGLLSIFVPPVGLIAACRLARPGSIWAQLFYDGDQISRSRARFDPATSQLEVLRHRLTDFVAGRHDVPSG